MFDCLPKLCDCPINMAEYPHLGEEIQQLFVVKELTFVELIQPSEKYCHKHMFVLHVVLVKV